MVMELELARAAMTAQAFDAWVHLPENIDQSFELIGGEIYDVVANNYSSLISISIASEFRQFCKGKGLGFVTGADGGYIIGGERFMPDVAFISIARQPEPCRTTYNPQPPDLAVEVLSPTDSPAKIRRKMVSYLLVGVTVWLVDPDAQTVEIFAPGKAVLILGLADTLDGGDILPGFSLPVADVFAR